MPVCLFISELRMGFDLDLSAGRQRGTGTFLIPSKPRTKSKLSRELLRPTKS